ncbi:MAG: VWA domain-containing protein [Pseudomonadota bacterium]
MSCAQETPRGTGLYMLVDTSGTYTEEIDKARQIINVVLTRMDSADAFAVARVDTGSFSERDIIAKAVFDDRPSVANQQKRGFRATVDTFVEEVKPSPYTDITGGVLQASEYLTEKQTGEKIILIFSDLKEDLQEGYVRDLPLALDGVKVIALNVTKLRSDNINPREYMERLEAWRARVENGGGTWRVLNDLERIEDIWRP